MYIHRTVWRFVAVSLLLCTVAAVAEDASTAAAKRLTVVKIFAFGAVGDAGKISPGENDFEIVLSQSRTAALAEFEKLYLTGNPQGRSYALSGIKKLNPSRFNQLLIAVALSTDQVEVEWGCIITHERIWDVAKQIDRGKFQF